MLMGKVQELSVTKGKTIKAGDRDEWVRVEYSIKTTIDSDEEVQIVKANLEWLLDGWLAGLTVPEVSKPSAKPTIAPKTFFPDDLGALLTFEETADAIIIKPKQFLGTENFAKIADTVKKHGGVYVSAGKNSHFKIPKK